MEKQMKKKFDIMDYFSVIRTIAALLLSMLIVFVIILFVSETPGLAIQKLMTGPLETKRSFFNVVVRAIPLVFTGLGLTLRTATRYHPCVQRVTLGVAILYW